MLPGLLLNISLAINADATVLQIYSNSKFIKDKTYCFISVTGKTKANIEVARELRNLV